MINTKDVQVNNVIKGFHEAMLHKLKGHSQIKDDIVSENRIFSIICHDYNIEPRKCANIMNDQYGYNFTGDDIIQIFRNRKLANPNERREIWQWAEKVSEYFEEAISGNKKGLEEYEKIRHENPLKSGKKHDSQERIAAIMIYEKYPEIDMFNDIENLHILGNTLAKYFFYDISDILKEIYTPQQKKQKNTDNHSENNITLEQAQMKISRLENNLDRANAMLHDLQEEFEEQLEISKIKELTDFFAKLNSERYGCILDELLIVRKGVDELRKNDYELPIEINGLLIMVKKLIQFVKDSHIEPIMKINAVKEVSAFDVEFCNYDGTPFVSTEEKKQVRVISPGWIYKDKEVQISRPKVKEE